MGTKAELVILGERPDKRYDPDKTNGEELLDGKGKRIPVEPERQTSLNVRNDNEIEMALEGTAKAGNAAPVRADLSITTPSDQDSMDPGRRRRKKKNDC